MQQNGIYKIYNIFNKLILQPELHHIYISREETRIKRDGFLIIKWIIKIGTKD